MLTFSPESVIQHRVHLVNAHLHHPALSKISFVEQLFQAPQAPNHYIHRCPDMKCIIVALRFRYWSLLEMCPIIPGTTGNLLSNSSPLEDVHSYPDLLTDGLEHSTSLKRENRKMSGNIKNWQLVTWSASSLPGVTITANGAFTVTFPEPPLSPLGSFALCSWAALLSSSSLSFKSSTAWRRAAQLSRVEGQHHLYEGHRHCQRLPIACFRGYKSVAVAVLQEVGNSFMLNVCAFRVATPEVYEMFNLTWLEKSYLERASTRAGLSP